MKLLIDGNEIIGWNAAFRVEILEDTIYFFSENEKRALQGKDAILLAPLLTENRFCVQELVDKLKGQLSEESVYLNLIELEKKGLIQPQFVSLDKDLAAFCGLLKIDMRVARECLNEKSVYLYSSNNQVIEEVKTLLKKVHIQTVDDPKQASLSLVLTEDYLDPKINALHFSNPWLLVKPFGCTIWLGPLFDKKEGACYPCLVERIKQNRLEETFLAKKLSQESFASYATLHTTQQLGLSLMVMEVLKWIVTSSNDKIENKIFTFNTLNLAVQEHQIVKRPCCTHCRNNIVVQSPEIILQRQKAKMEYRCNTPEETLEKFKHLVSPLTGIIRYLEPTNPLDGSPFHIYTSGANNAIKNITKNKGFNTFRTYCSGKGTSPITAKAGSLCESLERFSGEFQGNEPCVVSSFEALGEQAIHPNKISLYSMEQYAKRDKINLISHSFNKIESPFPEETPISWAPMWSLTENRIKYVPFSYCYYLNEDFNEKWIGGANSNGCAAGNCLEEAILQGFFELVERDSIAIWWYNRLLYPQVDLDSFHIPYIQNLLKEYARLGREAWVLDITSDLQIPTFVAISRNLNKPFEEIFMGFGAHMDAHIALLRSLTEMNQLMGSKKFWQEERLNEEDQEKIDKAIIKWWIQEATIDSQPYLKPEGVVTANHYKKWKCDDLFEAILECRSIVEDLGLEFLVLDQTRPEIGLKVVRVIVPGLRHFWARYAPGRLYDVPVKMGKLKAPFKESQLNPIEMFL